MAFKMIKLPYAQDALEPTMSEKTLEFHYGKHYKKYVTTLNELTAGTHYESLTMEEVILESYQRDEKVYDNAAQAWNHAFFWNCLSPKKTQMSGEVLKSIKGQFGSLNDFKTQFAKAAAELFGSGWVWLVRKSNGDLAIEAMGNADNPMVQGDEPLLVIDVWEHAYYLDYQNERPKYASEFWKIVNWDFVAQNLSQEMKFGDGRKNKEVPQASAYQH